MAQQSEPKGGEEGEAGFQGEERGNGDTEGEEGGEKRAKWREPRESARRRLAEREGETKEERVDTGKGRGW